MCEKCFWRRLFFITTSASVSILMPSVEKKICPTTQHTIAAMVHQSELSLSPVAMSISLLLSHTNSNDSITFTIPTIARRTMRVRTADASAHNQRR